MAIRKTTEQFIQQAKQVYGDKYNYSKAKYITANTKVIIICPNGHEYGQVPNDHLRGKECRKCAGLSKLSTEEFIKRAKVVHGDKYDYSKAKYVDSRTKVTLICNCGREFQQNSSSHLKGFGCSHCSHSRPYEIAEYTRLANEVHSGAYDYSLVKFGKANRDKIKIGCPNGHYFYQSAYDHLKGHGCPCHKNGGGFDPSKKGYLYTLCDKETQNMKFGISNSYENRTKGLISSTPFEVKILKVWLFDNGYDCRNVEKLIHNNLDSSKFEGFDGCTEWFIVNNKTLNMLDLPPLLGATVVL